MAVVARGVDPLERWPCCGATGTAVTTRTPAGSRPSARRWRPARCMPSGCAAARLKGETPSPWSCWATARPRGRHHAALTSRPSGRRRRVLRAEQRLRHQRPAVQADAAPSLAHKGIGYGMPGMLVDGNDAAAVYAAVGQAVGSAAAGGGPALIEAITYRVEAHTNADDAPATSPGPRCGNGSPATRSPGSGSTSSAGTAGRGPPSPRWTPRPRRRPGTCGSG